MIVLNGVLLTSAHGQIRIDKFSFPTVQDTFYFKVDRLPENIDIASMGEDRVWNFRNLRSPFLNTISFSKYNSEKYDVPLLARAKLMMLLNQKFQFILKEDNDGMKFLACLNEQLIGANNKNHSYYDGESIFLKRSYNLGDSESHFYSKVAEIHNADIPAELESFFPENVDAIQVVFETEVSSVVDDYGMLELPSVKAEVLRVKQMSNVDAYYQYLMDEQWIEVAQEDSLNLFFEDYLGPKEEYFFFSNANKLPLAKISMSSSGEVSEIEYQIDPTRELAIKSTKTKTITAFPNPTFGETRFEFLNYPSGEYKIDIITTYGKTLWTETFDVENNKPIKVDFSFLTKGTYLYSISDSDGKKLSIKRLVIITP